MKPWRKVLFALIPVVGFLLLGEIVARYIIRTQLQRPWNAGWLLKNNKQRIPPQATGRWSFVRDPYNGFRLRESTSPSSRRPPRFPPVAKGANEIRILVMGDSVAYGIRLPEWEAWPARLQAHLQTWWPRKWRVEVHNGAVPAYGAQQCKRLLQSRLIELQPDIVLWHEWPELHDALALPEVMTQFQMDLNDIVNRSGLLFLLFCYRTRFIGPGDTGYHVYNLAPRQYGASETSFKAFKRWCEQRGVKAMIGVEYVYRSDEPAGSEQWISNRDLWSQAGLDSILLAKAYYEHEGSRQDLFFDDVHLSATGSDLTARVISDGLRRRWPQLEPLIAITPSPPATKGTPSEDVPKAVERAER